MNVIILLIFKISVVVFMAGSLLEMGLKLDPFEALKGFRNIRFVLLALFCGFILGPALAIAIVNILPLNEDYANGLLLMGMAPSAPFLPMLVNKAKGDIGYTATFMILSAIGTIIFMPIAVPSLVEGLSVSAWSIARPLLTVVLLPMIVGILILRYSRKTATVLHPWVRKITFVFMISTLVFSLFIYGKGLLGTPGSFALFAQLLFFAVLTLATYFIGKILVQDQRKVLTIGICTRNLGAAMAPLLAVPQDDQRAMVMVFLGLFIMIGASIFTSRKLAGKTEHANAKLVM